MASAIYFNGQRLVVPGAYSAVDASDLANLSPGAVGIVALIGTAEGGKPLSVDPTFSDATRPEKILQRYKSGWLRTAGSFAFAPSTDPSIPGGAQRIVGVKVNPATQSVITLQDANGADALVVTSVDWGQFTTQVSIEVDSGTNKGKKYTIVFEGTTEVFDDIGGSAVLDLTYDPNSNGYGTMSAFVNATVLRANATKAVTGLSAGFTQPATGVLHVASSGAGDTSQKLTVYGLSGTTPVKETLVLNGTSTVTGVQSFSKVTGCKLSAACAGTVTLKDTGNATVVAVSPAATVAGLSMLTNTPAAGVATVSIDSDTAVDVVLRGLDASGAEVAQRFDMTAGNTTPVVGTQVFSSLVQVELAEVAGARTITVAIKAAETSHATFNTTRKTADRLNTLAGFTANSLRRNTFLMTDVDRRPTASILSATLDFYADLFDAADTLTAKSQFVSAAKATNGGLPAANVGPLFLIGGSEGTTTITQWQQAFALLKKRRVNIIVPLTDDPAVHALLASHLVWRAGIGRSEANGYVGVGDNDVGATLSTLKTRIQQLNTRHLEAIVQEPQQFDPDTGLATWYPPYIYAAIAAGMQAGAPIGEPLTRKRPNVLDVRNDPSWTVEDDASDLIDAGAMISERVDGIGVRWIRSITTFLDDDDPVFGEMSANAALDTAVFELRRRVDLKVGRPGFRGSVATIKSVATAVLDQMITENILVDHRGLTVEQVGDAFPLSVGMAPILPINFVPCTIHVFVPRVAAA